MSPRRSKGFIEFFGGLGLRVFILLAICGGIATICQGIVMDGIPATLRFFDSAKAGNPISIIIIAAVVIGLVTLMLLFQGPRRK